MCAIGVHVILAYAPLKKRWWHWVRRNGTDSSWHFNNMYCPNVLWFEEVGFQKRAGYKLKQLQGITFESWWLDSGEVIGSTWSYGSVEIFTIWDSWVRGIDFVFCLRVHVPWWWAGTVQSCSLCLHIIDVIYTRSVISGRIGWSNSMYCPFFYPVSSWILEYPPWSSSQCWRSVACCRSLARCFGTCRVICTAEWGVGRH